MKKIAILFSFIFLGLLNIAISQQWTELGGVGSFPNAGNLSHITRLMASDGSANIYTAGYDQTSSPSYSLDFSKFNKQNNAWQSLPTTNLIFTNGSQLKTLNVDASGNLYVTVSKYDQATLLFGSTVYMMNTNVATPQWTVVGNVIDDEVTAMEISGMGDLFVATSGHGEIYDPANQTTILYPTKPSNVYKFDGTSWFATAPLVTNFTGGYAKIKTLKWNKFTDKLYACGTISNANNVKIVAEYDGTNWSELNATNTQSMFAGSIGIDDIIFDNAGNMYASGVHKIINGGHNGVTVAKYDFNTTTWTEAGATTGGLVSLANAGGPRRNLAVDGSNNLYFLCFEYDNVDPFARNNGEIKSVRKYDPLTDSWSTPMFTSATNENYFRCWDSNRFTLMNDIYGNLYIGGYLYQGSLANPTLRNEVFKLSNCIPSALYLDMGERPVTNYCPGKPIGNTVVFHDALHPSPLSIPAPTGAVYQWYINGVIVPNATSQSFSDNNPVDLNVYSCVVHYTDNCGNNVVDTAVSGVKRVISLTISGDLNIFCSGHQLSANYPNGTWSSSNSDFTVNSTGFVAYIGQNNLDETDISYTALTSCGWQTTTVTVNFAIGSPPHPGPIQGNTSFCINSTSQLTKIGATGWSSSNPSVATVDNNTGLVTGVGIGTATITCTYWELCSSHTESVVVTVSALPNIYSLTVIANICGTGTLQGTSYVHEDKGGGIWSSDDDAIATVDPVTGVVTGVSSGTTRINYTETNNGCSVTDGFIVRVEAMPIAMTPVRVVFCESSFPSITLTSLLQSPNNEVHTFSSSDENVATVDDNATITHVGYGTASITHTVISESGNCSASASFPVIVSLNPAKPTINGNLTFCAGMGTLLTSSSANGYRWYFNGSPIVGIVSTYQSYNATTPGVYSVLVSNEAGCKAMSDAVTITENALPAAPVITGNTTICLSTGGSNSTQLIGSPSGGTWSIISDRGMPLKVDQNGLVFSSSISPSATSVTYTITNANGCSSSTSVNVSSLVTPVVPAISGASNVCANSTTAFANTTAGGVWSSANTAIASVNSSTGIVTGVAAGSTTISYTVTNGSCSTTVIKTITVNAVPPPINVSNFTYVLQGTSTTKKLIDGLVFCSIPQSYTINVVGQSSTGVWSTNNTNLFSVNQASTGTNSCTISSNQNGNGIATFTITNQQNCKVFQDFPIVVAVVPSPTIANAPTKICASTTYPFSASTPGVWYYPHNSGSFVNSGIVSNNSFVPKPLSIGGPVTNWPVSFTVTNSYGCTNVTYIPIAIYPSIYNNTTISGLQNSICTNTTHNLTSNQSGGNWSFTGPILSITSPGGLLTAGTQTGTAIVTYVSNATNNPCAAKTTNVVQCGGRAAAVVNEMANFHFQLYPNPAKNKFTIKTENLIGFGQVIVSDLLGKQHITQTIGMGNNDVNISNLSKGIYLVTIIQNNERKTEKLIVE